MTSGRDDGELRDGTLGRGPARNVLACSLMTKIHGGPERVVAERYRLEERIGSGGAAEVWRATDERLDREVAVKLLRQDVAGAFRRRFANEARGAARVRHPAVVAVYDAGVDEGDAFIVMELVTGASLAERLGASRSFALPETVAVVRQLAGALDAAHAEGIVHCDVKPANVLIDPSGNAKLTDFGVARAAESRAERELLGTARYVSPEQVRGGPPTPRTDVYGLALVAYEMLAGAPAFDGDDTGELLRARLAGPPLPLQRVRLVPGAVDDVIRKALHPDPARRYASAGAFAAALERAASGDDRTEVLGAVPTARVAGAPEGGLARVDMARRTLLALLPLLGAALVLFGLFSFLRAFTGVGAPVILPNVVGRSFDEASAELRRLGLDVVREDRASRERAGTVIEQRPGAGSQVARGSRVTLVVSGIGGTPNVVGKNVNEAANILIAAGFKAPVRWEVDRTARGTPGTVLRQEPPADSEFRFGQEAKLFIVGPWKGKEKDDD